MKNRILSIKDIDVSDRLRPLNEEWAKTIAASIAANGLNNRIAVYHTPRNKKYRLIYGRHRLRAFEVNGLSEIVEGEHFKLLKVGRDQARLLEIEENLARNDVSLLERALLLKAYKDTVSGEFGSGGDRRSEEFKSAMSGGFEKTAARFVKHAAAHFDLSERKIERLGQIAEKLSEPKGLLERLHGTPVSRNQSQLLKLAQLPPEKLAKASEAFDEAEGDFARALELLEDAPKSRLSPEAKLRTRMVDSWGRINTAGKWQVLADIGVADLLTDEQLEALAERIGGPKPIGDADV